MSGQHIDAAFGSTVRVVIASAAAPTRVLTVVDDCTRECLDSAGTVQVLGQFNARVGMMKRIFSTAQVHPRDRFDYWHSIACKNLIVHDATPECRRTF